jgi:hypothetical protein
MNSMISNKRMHSTIITRIMTIIMTIIMSMSMKKSTYHKILATIRVKLILNSLKNLLKREIYPLSFDPKKSVLIIYKIPIIQLRT